jgi:hypothetical protein
MNYICTSQRCRTTCPFAYGLKKGGKLGDRFKVPEKGEMGVYWCVKKEQHGNRSVTRYLLAYRSCTGKVAILETNMQEFAFQYWSLIRKSTKALSNARHPYPSLSKKELSDTLVSLGIAKGSTQYKRFATEELQRVVPMAWASLSGRTFEFCRNQAKAAWFLGRQFTVTSSVAYRCFRLCFTHLHRIGDERTRAEIRACCRFLGLEEVKQGRTRLGLLGTRVIRD